MSSQDTQNYAQDEEQSAKILQDEIAKEQANLANLTDESEINSKNSLIEGLQQKQQEHSNNAQRLNQQAAQEQQQEQKEALEKDQNGDKSLGEATRDGILNNMF